MNTSPNRRRFLADVSGAAAGIAVARVIAQTVRADTSALPAAGQGRSFRGLQPGEEREVERTRVCWCPPGRFTMGSPPAERGRRPDEAQVEVTLSRGFWTAKSEVTQGQWKSVMGKFPDRLPSPEFGEGDTVPAYWINFDEAEAFCAEMSRRGHRSGALPESWEFRLPTEAQWEYACRAGTTGATAFGDSMTRQQANFAIDSPDRSCSREGQRPQGRQLSGQSPGASMTCTATSGNGAGITTTRSCRAARIPICMTGRAPPTVTARTLACVAAAPGSSLNRSAARRAACATSRTGAPTTSASAWSSSSAPASSCPRVSPDERAAQHRHDLARAAHHPSKVLPDLLESPGSGSRRSA